MRRMYLKVVGMGIAFFSCVCLGKLMAERYVKRYYQLLDVENIVNCFETEICYTCTPVIEILDSLIDRLKWPLNDVLTKVLTNLTEYGYRPLSETWRQVMYESRSNLALKEQDLEVIIEFGDILGTTDKENQKKYFAVIKSRLNTQISEAYEEKTKYSKLFNQLGIISGLFIVILLI